MVKALKKNVTNSPRSALKYLTKYLSPHPGQDIGFWLQYILLIHPCQSLLALLETFFTRDEIDAPIYETTSSM